MKRETEGSLQHVVSIVLRTGVVVSAVCGILSGGYYLVLHGGERVSYGTFRNGADPDRHVPTILANALHLEPRALMMMALMLLILTPIVRVIVSLIGFIKERDRVYIVVTTVVLVTLLASLFFGGATE